MTRPECSVWIIALLVSAGLSSLASGDAMQPPNALPQGGALPLKEMSEQEIQEARKSFERTAEEVRKKLEIHDRREIQREDGTVKSFPAKTRSLAEIIDLLKEANDSIPSNEDYFSRRNRIATLFFDSITAEKSFPDETRLWAYEVSIYPPHPKSIFLWWEHNEEAVASGKYAEAKWLGYSYASKSDERFATNSELEVQVAAEMAKRDGLPYAHLEVELAELQKTHDARVKRRSDLRLQWEKEMEGIEIARRAQPIKEQKEREKRRQQSTLSSAERKATRSQEDESASNPASNLIRWSPLAAIPILGGIYLVLRKRFLISR